MKKLSKLLVVLMTSAIILPFASCNLNDDGDDNSKLLAAAALMNSQKKAPAASTWAFTHSNEQGSLYTTLTFRTNNTFDLNTTASQNTITSVSVTPQNFGDTSSLIGQSYTYTISNDGNTITLDMNNTSTLTLLRQ